MAKKTTFAQEAKKITNKYKLRLGEKFDKGDPLALAAMNAELAELRDKQEAAREAELGVQPQFAKGGKLPMYDGFNFSQKLNANTFNQNRGINAITQDQTGFTSNSLPATAAEAIAAIGSTPNGQDGFQSRVPWVGAAAGVLGSILSNKKMDMPSYEYEEYKPTQLSSHLVDYSRGREQTLRERDLSNAIIRNKAAATGSQAGLMENIIAGTTGTQRVAGEGFNQSLEQEQNVNAQIQNETAARNAQMQTQAAEMNARNKLFSTEFDRQDALMDDQRRRSMITGITDSITGYGKDRLAANQYDQMINMMAPDNYKIREGKDSLFRRIFQISPDMKINFKNTGDSV